MPTGKFFQSIPVFSFNTMALSVQNLRAVGTGVEPTSLLPGQIAFNVTDKVLYVGDETSTKTSFDGTSVPGTPGEGWYSMPMDFDSLSEYYVPNPGYYGDTPLDQQVLTWSTALNHPIWTSSGGVDGNHVYVVTNAQVAVAPGATTSDKINAAIGMVSPSPDEGDVCIVTGLPDEVYEGLYFYTTAWVKGAAYAYPSASEVIYNNTGTSLGATVQAAITDLNNGLISTTAIANTANSTANSALSVAAAALPRAGGVMTGNIQFQDAGEGVIFSDSSSILAISDSISTTSSTDAASATAVKTAYDFAATAVPRSSFLSSGDLLVGTGSGTFAPLPAGAADYILASDGLGSLVWVSQSKGDVTSVTGTAPITVDNTDPQTPIVGVDLATTATPGVVQIELTGNLTLVGGVIDVPNASTTVKGAVQLNNTLSSNSTTLALTAAQGKALQDQIDALTLSNSVTLAGGYNATTGLVDGATTQGTAAGFVDGSAPPAPAPGNADFYLICTTSGNNPSAMENGDWLLSDGTQYVVLGVGSRPASASYTQAGIVQLADGPAVETGTSDTTAITPQALQDNVIDSVTTANSSLIASATAVKTAYDAAVAAQATANAALPKAGGTMTGTISAHNVNIQSTYFLQFDGGVNGSVSAISNSTSTTSSTTAASATAVKSAYDAGIQGQTDAAAAQATANAALPKAGGTMTGTITFDAGQTFPASGIQDATTGQKGIVQVGSNIQVTGGTISVNNASTATSGVVQLNDTLASTSTTQALTANQGYQLQQQINALATATNLTFAGTVNGSTGNMATVTTEGSSVGFIVGSALPATSAAIDEYFVIVTTAGTMTPTGGSSTAVVVGDWFLASASSWTYIAAGYLPPAASTTTPGIVELATDAETQAGVNSSNAVVPSALQSKMSDSVATTSSVTIASSTAVKSAYDLASAAVPCSTYSTVGTLVAGTGAGTISGLSLGVNGQFLAVNTACSTGLQWINLPQLCGYTCTATPFNTAIGANAGDSITSGTCNTVVGYNAGTGITTGVNNVALGTGALDAATTGSNNVAIGRDALGSNSTGSNNIAIGLDALAYGNGGSSNMGIGLSAGANISSGTNNVIVGSQAGDALTTASNNVAVGWGSLSAATTSGGSVAVGFQALAVSTAASLTAVGTCALAANTSGAGNTAVGFNAGLAITTGSNNTILGLNAGDTVTTGTQNTFVGACSGGLVATTSEGNTGLGFSALGAGVTSGAYNTALGNNAGAAVTSGALNTLVGYTAGSAITTGGFNTLVGRYTGTATLSNNVVLSDGAGTIRFQANSSGAISLGAGGAYGTAGQTLVSGGAAAAPTWETPQILSYTDTFATTAATPVNLLSFSGAVRMGTLTVMLTDNATNVAWANVTIAADTGIGSSVVTTSGGTFGTFAIINSAGNTVVEFTPSASLASVSASYKYTASFGAQPTVL
jgi:hypothetical protein